MGNINAMAFSRFENRLAFVRDDSLTIELELNGLQFKFFRIGRCVHIIFFASVSNDFMREVFMDAANRIRRGLT